MKCPSCSKRAKFIRDRGFKDGSGLVYTCLNEKCKSHMLYFYKPPKQTMKTQKVKIVIYKAKDGYRWQMKRCGRIVAESGEAYVRSTACLKSVTNLVTTITKFQYTFETPKK